MLSKTTTRYPARCSAFAAWLPMYPAPPVTRTPRPSAANGEVREALRLHLLGRIDVASVENDWRSHQRPHLAEVGLAELVPLGDDRQRVGAVERVVALVAQSDAAVEQPLRDRPGGRIVRLHARALVQEQLDDRNRRRLAHVVGSRLERKSPERDRAAGQIPEMLLHLLD